MRAVSFLFGVLFVLLGIGLFCYVGLYLCLFGGVMSIIEGAKQDPVSSSMVAWGIVRAVCTTFAGGLAALVGYIPAIACFTAANRNSLRGLTGLSASRRNSRW